MPAPSAEVIRRGADYGCWTVLRETSTDRYGRAQFWCRASCCKRERALPRYQLLRLPDRCTHCTNRRATQHLPEIEIGAVYGTWKVLRETTRCRTRNYAVRCTSCGCERVKTVAEVRKALTCVHCTYKTGARTKIDSPLNREGDVRAAGAKPRQVNGVCGAPSTRPSGERNVIVGDRRPGAGDGSPPPRSPGLGGAR